MLRPSSIMFSQNSIKNQFQNGCEIESFIYAVATRRLKLSDVPPICVWKLPKNGHQYSYYSEDNRRLYAYRVLEKMKILDEISVKYINSSHRSSSKFNTQCYGCHINVRSSKRYHHCECQQTMHEKLPTWWNQSEKCVEDIVQSFENDIEQAFEKKGRCKEDNNFQLAIILDDSDRQSSMHSSSHSIPKLHDNFPSMQVVMDVNLSVNAKLHYNKDSSECKPDFEDTKRKRMDAFHFCGLSQTNLLYMILNILLFFVYVYYENTLEHAIHTWINEICPMHSSRNI